MAWGIIGAKGSAIGPLWRSLSCIELICLFWGYQPDEKSTASIKTLLGILTSSQKYHLTQTLPQIWRWCQDCGPCGGDSSYKLWWCAGIGRGPVGFQHICFFNCWAAPEICSGDCQVTSFAGSVLDQKTSNIFPCFPSLVYLYTMIFEIFVYIRYKCIVKYAHIRPKMDH